VEAFLEGVAVTLWGILLVRYWLTQDINLLIHPAYKSLTLATGLTLLIMTGIRLILLIQKKSTTRVQHMSSLPRVIGSILLLGIALAGFWVPLRIFASDIANDRGLNDFTALNRPQPQTFRSASRPEDRTLVDWVRTLNVYPEPDAYTGQNVKVQGFVVYPEDLPDNYLLLSRLVITCCAADAYPVGLPVKLSQTRKLFNPNTWLEVEGEMVTETLSNQRKLVIQPKVLNEITEPKNPYEY
jgi:uncharacterized repeat protein (TIGR03943 family)